MYNGASQLSRRNDTVAKKMTILQTEADTLQEEGKVEMDFTSTLYLYSRLDLTERGFLCIRKLQQDLLRENNNMNRSNELAVMSWGKFVKQKEALHPRKDNTGEIVGPKPWKWETRDEDPWEGVCRHVRHGPSGSLRWVQPGLDVAYTPGSMYRLGPSMELELAGDGSLQAAVAKAKVLRGNNWEKEYEIVAQVLTGCDGTAHKNSTSSKTGLAKQILAGGHMIARLFLIKKSESIDMCLDPNHSPFTGDCDTCHITELWRYDIFCVFLLFLSFFFLCFIFKQ